MDAGMSFVNDCNKKDIDLGFLKNHSTLILICFHLKIKNFFKPFNKIVAPYIFILESV